MMKRIGWIIAAGISLLLLAACGTNDGPPMLPPETAATMGSQAVMTAQTEASKIPETKETEAVTEPAPEAETTAVQTEASTESTEPTEPAETKAPTPSVQPTEPAPAARTAAVKPTQPPKPSEPAKTTEPPKATESKATDPPNPTEPPKPSEAPVPSEPPASTEEAAQPTEAPVEPPKAKIDATALEAYGNEVAANMGFQVDHSMTTGNSGFFPPDTFLLSSMDEGRQLVREAVVGTKDYLMAYVGSIYSARCRVVVTSNGDGWYTITVLYG